MEITTVGELLHSRSTSTSILVVSNSYSLSFAQPIAVVGGRNWPNMADKRDALKMRAQKPASSTTCWCQKKMLNDEIVDEVRAIRDAHAAKFGYDLRAIYEDLKKSETEHIAAGHLFVSSPSVQLAHNE